MSAGTGGGASRWRVRDRDAPNRTARDKDGNDNDDDDDDDEYNHFRTRLKRNARFPLRGCFTILILRMTGKGRGARRDGRANPLRKTLEPRKRMARIWGKLEWAESKKSRWETLLGRCLWKTRRGQATRHGRREAQRRRRSKRAQAQRGRAGKRTGGQAGGQAGREGSVMRPT